MSELKAIRLRLQEVIEGVGAGGTTTRDIEVPPVAIGMFIEPVRGGESAILFLGGLRYRCKVIKANYPYITLKVETVK